MGFTMFGSSKQHGLGHPRQANFRWEGGERVRYGTTGKPSAQKRAMPTLWPVSRTTRPQPATKAPGLLTRLGSKVKGLFRPRAQGRSQDQG
jgi:hypothetical protein